MNTGRYWLALFLMTLSWQSQADILVGQTVGVTGTVAATVKESMQGAQLYIDHVNAQGGVNGEKVSILTLDDKFDTQLALDNAQTLIEKKQVVALFMPRGTPHTQGLIPLLNKHGVPLIGPSTGAMALHQPVQKHVFNVRATYQREAEKAVTHLAFTGVKRMALVAVDDSFGNDALVGAENGLTKSQLQPAVTARFDRSNPDFANIAPSVVKAQAQAVMMIGSGTAVVKGVQAIRAAGSSAQFITLSNNASDGFIQLLGASGAGMIVSQVFPNSLVVGLVHEADQLARAKGLSTTSPALLEGFASAKVLVEALRRAGKSPTRERVQTVLENFQYDLGGLPISYTPQDHSGLDFADLSIITASGKFRR